MRLFSMILICGLTFGVCFLLDRCFTRFFRGKQQHRSGLQVRHSKRYASFGLILGVLGLTAIFTGLSGNTVLLIGGSLVLVMAVGLVAHYLCFGVFYDADSFIRTSFGRKSTTYRFSDIQGQRLYLIQGGNIMVDLHLSDGSSLSIQSTMEGAYPFLDHAFAAWCRQKNINPGDCAFHDPANSLWFPTVED